jgi:hypothetical protein
MRWTIISLLVVLPVAAEPPLKSGLDVDQRPGPYSSLVVVGKERGTQHCYVCEAEDRPVMIVFARTPSEPLGKLVHAMDDVVKKNTAVDLRGWVTFLAADAGPVTPKVLDWSRKSSTGSVPIAVFEDEVGPPAYRIARDADVTVLLSVKQKVVANFAFRGGELNPAGIDRVLQAVPRILPKK